MNGFKRFCMVAFALMGLFLMAALLLPWFGPWTQVMGSLLSLDWYLFMCQVFGLCAVVGFLCVLVAGLRGRKQRDVRVLSEEGGSVTIARSAVASQATFIVEEDGLCVAQKVFVDTHRRDRVDVRIQVQPYRSLDVRAEAKVLQQSLREGLTVLCGDALGDITLRFLEPRETGEIVPGNVVERHGDGSFEPSAAHRVERAVRREERERPVKAPAFGVDVPVAKAQAPAASAPARADKPDKPAALEVHVEPTPSDAENQEA